MNATKWLVPICTAAAIGVTSTRTDAALAPDLFKRYGGTYLSDCSNPSSAKVTIFENDLVFLQGDRRVAGTNLEAQHSFFGQSPPPGYLVALVSESGQEQVLAIVYSDESGDYLQIDGDARLMAQVGKAAQALKYRRCDKVGQAAPAAPSRPAAPPVARTASAGVTAGGLLLDPAFKAAWRKALGPLIREEWLAALDGPGTETRKIRVAGADYLQAAACMNHDCADHNVVFLYSTTRRVVYAKVQQKGRFTLLGAPTAAMAKELDRLWREQWRRNP